MTFDAIVSSVVVGTGSALAAIACEWLLRGVIGYPSVISLTLGIRFVLMVGFVMVVAVVRSHLP